MTVATPFALAVAGAAVVGLAAGIPFAPSFAGAARVRPDAPGAAVGFVNMIAAVTILVGTPLLGLTFSLPGERAHRLRRRRGAVSRDRLRAAYAPSSSVSSAFWTCSRFSASSQIADRLP